MNTEHRKTLSSFSISSTNIRSLCMTDRKKRLRKLLAIKHLDTDISVIIDSQVNEADESFLYKHHRLIMSEYNITSNYKKPRGITILIKKKTGITLGHVETVDDNILIFSILTASNETIDIAAIYEYKRHRPAPRLWAVFSRAAPRAPFLVKKLKIGEKSVGRP